MLHCFNAVRHKLDGKRGYFDLIGCDFLVSDDFQVTLLEMNCNPALHTNCSVLKNVTPRVVEQTLGQSIYSSNDPLSYIFSVKLDKGIYYRLL